jgi:hypothetical protein
MSGCLINPTDEDLGVLSVVKIRPDYNLQAAPEGTCYQLWFLDVNDYDFPTLFFFTPLVRFLWDPVNFRTLNPEDSTDIPLYTQEGLGVDVGSNFLDHVIVMITVEPLDDPHPQRPDGPILGMYVDPSPFTGEASPLQVNQAGTIQLDFFGPGIVQIPGQGSSTLSLVAQSLQMRRQREGEDVCWRDTTEGYGIWFARTEVNDLVIEDTVGFSVNPEDTIGRGTVFTWDVNDNPGQERFTIWLFPSHPESSWSNFDDVFPGTAPDLVFRDGVPERTLDPPDSTGVNALGSNPFAFDNDGNVIEADLESAVGFMYFPDTIPPFFDTCFLRVDQPNLSYCTNDSSRTGDATGYPYYYNTAFIDTNLLIRVFTSTWADTLVTPSLLGLPSHQILPAPEVPGFEYGYGLEYEAWLIFDSVNAYLADPMLKPLSLGRITPWDYTGDLIPDGAQHADDSNPYTPDEYFDPNFDFPGEDFLENLPNGLPSPLNIFALPNVTRPKLWITMEPVHRPDEGVYDWAPDMPFEQLVTYVADLVPETQMDTLVCDRGTQPQALPLYNLQMQFRPISTLRSDLAEGNNWPTVTFFVSSPE